MPTMVFPTALVGWVLGGGVLVVTRDGGSSWSRVSLGYVAAISRSGSSLWAFVSPCNAAPSTCRYRLEATTIAAKSWHEVGLLPAPMGDYGVVVARLTARRAVIDNGQEGPGVAFVTTDGGAHWTAVHACGSLDFSPVTLVATRARDFLVMCLGGAAAGSVLKALSRSTDGGRTWDPVAIDRGLGLPAADNPIPTAEGVILAVTSATRLWMMDVNMFYGSLDGGKRWFKVPRIGSDGAGSFASFSFISAADGWVLAPGSGLWRTTDESTWQSV
jgi:photosystem II stability/assembly factor-like uncharacterized protein